MKKLVVGKWYWIKWHDAYSSVDTDWTPPSKLHTGPLVIHSAGKLIKKTQGYVMLAQTVDTNSGKVSCLMSIPLGMIVQVQCFR